MKKYRLIAAMAAVAASPVQLAAIAARIPVWKACSPLAHVLPATPKTPTICIRSRPHDVDR